MVVLDSTFLIDFLKNKKNAVEQMRFFSQNGFTTRLNVFEVLIGIHRKKHPAWHLALFNDFIQTITILELDGRSAALAAKISAELSDEGKSVADNDVLIAAIALTNGEDTVVTQNVKDFSKISGIKVQTY